MVLLQDIIHGLFLLGRDHTRLTRSMFNRVVGELVTMGFDPAALRSSILRACWSAADISPMFAVKERKNFVSSSAPFQEAPPAARLGAPLAHAHEALYM